MTNLQTFAKVAGLNEQQAFTFAMIVRSYTKAGMSLEQAVEATMASLKQLTT